MNLLHQLFRNVYLVFPLWMGSSSEHTGYTEQQILQTQYVTQLFNKKGAFHWNSFPPLSGTDDMLLVLESLIQMAETL